MGKVTDALASLIGRIPTRTAFLLAWLATWTVPASAVGDGSAGLVQATQMVTGYFDPATKLIYAAGALCGLIGACLLYTSDAADE